MFKLLYNGTFNKVITSILVPTNLSSFYTKKVVLDIISTTTPFLFPRSTRAQLYSSDRVLVVLHLLLSEEDKILYVKIVMLLMNRTVLAITYYIVWRLNVLEEFIFEGDILV